DVPLHADPARGSGTTSTLLDMRAACDNDDIFGPGGAAGHGHREIEEKRQERTRRDRRLVSTVDTNEVTS
ncbi:MAG TPA: hypothetical protein VIC55_10935, partial [Gemmatimonadaceae bacterium]